jgi:SAM-dependent methyltransferase
MVDAQLRGRDVVDERVLAAMDRVPRELFVPEKQRDHAYDDAALPIGEGQTISQPYMVARICEALGLTGSEHVLDVGTGSGYQAAVLAELAEEVDTIERIPALAERARANLVVARSAGPGAFRRDRCRRGSARVAAVPLRPTRAPGATRGARWAAGNAAPRGDCPQPGGTGDPPLGSLPFRPSTGGRRVLTRCVRSVRAPWGG